MPELPEVETIRKGLQEYLVGHTIRDIEVRMPKIVEGETNDIIGGKVIGVRRFGKGLVIDLDNEYLLAIHIKLTGQLIYQNNKLRIKNKGRIKIIKGTYSALPHKSTHVIFTLDKHAVLYYNDFRRFGWIRIVKSSKLKEQSFFKDLGHEFPMGEVSQVSKVPQVPKGERQDALSLEDFIEILKKTKGSIKPLLLDQKKMAGLGNIYANDGLWLAGIDPRKSAKTLNDKEIKKLYKIGRAHV